jgi:hypothetical protein
MGAGAPNPGVSDYNLLFRFKLTDGTVTGFSRVALKADKKIGIALFNPKRRLQKRYTAPGLECHVIRGPVSYNGLIILSLLFGFARLGPVIPFLSLPGYSDLRLFTGFSRAALIAWKLTVARAINRATRPANPKIHQPISMR